VHLPHCAVDEKLIKYTANAMKDLGLVDAGYTYLNLDGEHITVLQ
jgi:hypothetical protein